LWLAGLALLLATPAYATPINPGDTSIAPTAYTNPGGVTILYDSGYQLFTFGAPGLQVTVFYDFLVARDPLSPPLYACGSNCVDFALDAGVVSGPVGKTTTLNSIFLEGFGGSAASIDVGYLTDASLVGAPSGADRSPNPDSGTITFDYAAGIPVSFNTKTLVLRTNLTDWNGTAAVGFNATVAYPLNYESGVATITPEPASVVLLGSGLLLALRRKKRA
jgi:hypothetical protein